MKVGSVPCVKDVLRTPAKFFTVKDWERLGATPGQELQYSPVPLYPKLGEPTARGGWWWRRMFWRGRQMRC
jgi:hypothetical protein